VRLLGNRRVSDWIFEHYLGIAHPSFVDEGPRISGSRALRLTPLAAS
jgi:hypothetical protein